MSEAYRAAGVDTEAAAKAVGLIAELAASTRRPEVADTLGGFAGLFDIGGGKLLAAATDGVGTKLEIARLTGRRRTVGIDLVAMCVDDIVCVGAEPLFFLDYLAVGRVVPEQVAELVEGVAEGCRLAGCALLGGETAEHPGTMPEDQFDLAGFCVGVVQDTALLGAHRVREGDVLIGLASSGLHANGYSLVRRALLDGRPLDAIVPELGRPLADELLEPCTIHAPVVLDLHRRGLLHAGRAHHRRRARGERAPDDARGPRRSPGPRNVDRAGDLRAAAARGRPVRRRSLRDVQHGARDGAGRGARACG